MTAATTQGDDAARLLVDADSFLRLGLIDKATEHLAQAVRRDPSLRSLREPLVKLYVIQRRYQSAIAELWALLSPCDDPYDEIRFLRYIIRLGERGGATEQRLKAAIDRAQTMAGKSGDQPAATGSVKEVGGELRSYLGKHRPPTDMARTQDVPDSEQQRFLSALELPSALAQTRPNAVEVEVVAEAIALSSGSLKEALKEIDTCLWQQRYPEARKRLEYLVIRYPHSRRVRARIQQLAEAEGGTHGPLSASLHQTQEVAPVDITEETELPAPSAPPAARSQPPPPPTPSFERQQALKSEAAQALHDGIAQRNAGQHMEAIATLMAGINKPNATDTDLSELFYALGATYEQMKDPGEAILFYQMAIGGSGFFRDAAHRIATLTQSGLKRS